MNDTPTQAQEREAIRVEDRGTPVYLDGVVCQFTIVDGPEYPYSRALAYVLDKSDAERIVKALNSPAPASGEAVITSGFSDDMLNSGMVDKLGEEYEALAKANPAAGAEPVGVVRHVPAPFYNGTHAQAFLNPNGEQLPDHALLYAGAPPAPAAALEAAKQEGRREGLEEVMEEFQRTYGRGFPGELRLRALIEKDGQT